MTKTETITVRGLEPETKQKLRMRAARHGHSMEQEARDILRRAVNGQVEGEDDLGSAIHRRFAALGGVDLNLPPRRPDREPPDFSE